MKKFYSLTGIFLIFIFLSACKSASKLYEKGKYDEAVEVAVKKLQKDPNDAKLRALVQDAYDYAVNDHQRRINSYAESSNELKWEWMYNEYTDLQRLYNAIYKSPTVFELVKPVDYSSFVITYGEKAGDVHVERGMTLMENNDKQSFKKAYREFQTALAYKPGDINIKQMITESYEAAVTRVLVMPADDQAYRFSSYRNEFSNFDNDIVRDLQYQSGSDFVRFYSTWDLQRLNVVPDEVIETHFTQLNIGRIQENFSIREVEKEIVVKETVYKNKNGADSVVRQYGKVRAKITTTKRNMYSEGNLTINVRNNGGRWLWNDNTRGTHTWSTEYSTFTGDERALSEEDKKLVNRPRENAPREDEIMRCIKDDIYRDFVYRVRNYYSRY